MPRATWLLHRDRPSIQIILENASGTRSIVRTLLADTGAGTLRSAFEILLDEVDCLTFGGIWSTMAGLSGAYAGSFPVYFVRVQIPQLNFDRRIRAIGVRTVPSGFNGIACFRFLNNLTYGNFGNPGQFGIEI